MNKLLIDELEAGENSFLLDIRCNINWDHDKFVNLVTLINEYTKSIKACIQLDRQIASGIWYIFTFVQDWTSHDSFRNHNTRYSIDYYNEAYDLLYEVCNYFFTGILNYIDDNFLKSEIDKFNDTYAS
ncbi:hypothetical protein J14TS5_18090 [Paenibacillus lautus]|uniref:hypothetical protein n=1 Tax=Paenibacillus lautus TaxID=1401 RepID=UPI001B2D736F|nr:hypothetical protein [Paenibacillus lautus]GIO96723.1 hypothetical protein J14TS5_18090 [Paenibacillus lautus]